MPIGKTVPEDNADAYLKHQIMGRKWGGSSPRANSISGRE